METEPELLTVRKLVELRKHDFAKPNPEYQRGSVWKTDQQMKLIDSVLRGYQLPIIYLHYRESAVAGLKQESYDIIDGQQRINALYYFAEGAFPLYKVDDPKAKFPKFIQEQPCPWGGKYFHGLPPDLKNQFFDARIPVSYIKTDDQHEVRDLFVRLQSGLPLNPQEKRDAYPGRFNEFVFSLGGKPGLPQYPGHPFFSRVAGMEPSSGRGKARQLAAQIAMLFLSRRINGTDQFPNINATAIDDYYYENLDFDGDSRDCQRLREILGKLDDLLGDEKRPKMKGHEAIHLVLLLDSLWDDYLRSWESRLQEAHGNFLNLLREATKMGDKKSEIYLQYGLLASSGADKGDNIRIRHHYYTTRMMEFLGELTLKDPKRLFGQTDKDIIYWRAGGKCQRCGAVVRWKEAEFHHVEEHSKGGKTELDNGALVHKGCHPKGPEETQAFARKFEEWRKAQAAR